MVNERAKRGDEEGRCASSEGIKRKPVVNVGAIGFGLSESQQKAVADLWAWQEESLRSVVILGGPIRRAV